MTHNQKLILHIIVSVGLLTSFFFANLAMRLSWDYALINVVLCAIITYTNMLYLGDKNENIRISGNRLHKN